MPAFDEYSNADLFAALAPDSDEVLGVLMIDGEDFYKEKPVFGHH